MYRLMLLLPAIITEGHTFFRDEIFQSSCPKKLVEFHHNGVSGHKAKGDRNLRQSIWFQVSWRLLQNLCGAGGTAPSLG